MTINNCNQAPQMMINIHNLLNYPSPDLVIISSWCTLPQGTLVFWKRHCHICKILVTPCFFLFKMGFIPGLPQQCNLCWAVEWPCSISLHQGGFGGLAFTLCSSSQIYIESVPQNYLLTDHIEISIEDRHKAGRQHALPLLTNKFGCP